MPPLIIQPLVENAVVHGLDNNAEGASVKVAILREGNAAMFTITDNGIGIPEERMDKIMQTLEDAEEREGERIGLRNVHVRLKLTYGESCGLSIRSKPGCGTAISFAIPLEGGMIDA